MLQHQRYKDAYLYTYKHGASIISERSLFALLVCPMRMEDARLFYYTKKIQTVKTALILERKKRKQKSLERLDAQTRYDEL